MQTSLFPMSGQADSPARTSQWREWAQERGFEGSSLDSFMNMLTLLETDALELFSSRTFRASSAAMEDGTSKSLFERWPTSGILSDGVFLTAGTSESPSRVSESTLLGLIETGEVPDRYFLSPNAARGIIRRADRMGRNLFPPLRQALEILAEDR